MKTSLESEKLCNISPTDKARGGFGSCQVGIISEGSPWPDMSLQRQEGQPCSLVRASGCCLWGLSYHTSYATGWREQSKTLCWRITDPTGLVFARTESEEFWAHNWPITLWILCFFIGHQALNSGLFILHTVSYFNFLGFHFFFSKIRS